MSEVSSFAELMEQRWSCRAFRAEPVADDVLREVFATAQRTASWCNTQSWEVHLLSGDALAWFGKELHDHVVEHPDPAPDIPLPAEYRGIYADRRREAGVAMYRVLGIERHDTAGRVEQAMLNYLFFGAPHAVVITTDAIHGTYGAVDCGGYVANLMNAALDHGLGSVALGSIGMQAGKVRELLDLPADRLVVCGLAFGLPAEEHPVNGYRTSRAALDELVRVVEAP